MNRVTDRGTERGLEIRCAQTGDFRDVLERQILTEVVLNIGKHLLEPAPGNASLRGRHFVRLGRMPVQ